MYSCTLNDYCLSYVSDMIAASTCDLLRNCVFDNKNISYKKIVQLYFCRYKCIHSRSSIIFDNFTVNTNP